MNKRLHAATTALYQDAATAAEQHQIALMRLHVIPDLHEHLDLRRYLGRQFFVVLFSSELTVARNCLLNTEMKAQYDARLQAAGVQSIPPPPGGPRAPVPSAGLGAATEDSAKQDVPRPIPVSSQDQGDDVPTSQTGSPARKPAAKPAATGGMPTINVAAPGPGRTSGSSSRTSTPARRNGNGTSYASRSASKQASQTPWIIAGCGAGVVLFVLLIAALNSGDDSPPVQPAKPQPKQVSKKNTKNTSKRTRSRPRPSSTGSKWRDGAAAPSGPRTLADLADGPDDSPVENNTVTGQLTAARRAMSERKIDAARAKLHAAAELARSPFERQEVERVEKHLDSLETFWQTVQEETYRLGSAQELRNGDEFFMVSEARDGVLTIRHAGRFHRYTALELPPVLAIAVFQRRMKPGKPETHLHVGSMLAIDAQGDRQVARRHWEQAGEAGKALLPELELAPPVAKPEKPSAGEPPLRTGPMLLENLAGSNAPGAGPAEPAGSRQPIPDAEALAKVEPAIRRMFQAELEGARDHASRAATAKRLASAAAETKDDPAARYAIYQLARQLAEESCDAEAICTVVDWMAGHFQIDPLREKGEALRRAWQSLAGGNQRLEPAEIARYRRNVVTRCVVLLDSALAHNNYQAADDLCTVAIAAARILKDYRALRDYEAKAEQIKTALRGG